MKKVFIGTLFGLLLVAGAFGLHYEIATLGMDSNVVVPIAGEQHFSATIQYPADAGPLKHSVVIWLDLDKPGNHIMQAQVDKHDQHIYNMQWDSKTTTNGPHTIIIQAFYGKAMIGEKSRHVIVSN